MPPAPWNGRRAGGSAVNQGASTRVERAEAHPTPAAAAFLGRSLHFPLDTDIAGLYGVRMSVTSKQILQATGLKTAKTLTRWAKSGIIPGPHVGTHPAGRGKIAYWPNWVLERCQRIAELMRQGHTLGSAASVLESERTLRLIDEVEKSPDLGALLSKKVELPNGRETSLELVIDAFIARAVDNIALGEGVRNKLIMQLRKAEVAELSLRLFHAGYNPICVFNGERIEVIPDFLVSHRLSDEQSVGSTCLMIPTLPPLRKAFSAFGRTLPQEPVVRPAPKVCAREGDTIVEYQIVLGGQLGFELLRETADTVGFAQQTATQARIDGCE